MLKLENASLLDFCNPAVKNDRVFKAICAAFDPTLQQILSKYQNAKIFSNLNNQPDWVLDFIALYHFNVDYYDTTLPKGTKLKLIQNVIQDKINKGTPQRIIDILTTVFGYAELVEWWDPNGIAAGMAPNTFGVNMAGVTFNPTQLQQATRAVMSGKNVRSYFTGFRSITTGMGTNYTGVMIGEYDFTILSNAPWVVTGPKPPP